MLPLARALIRRRWIVIVLWTILGAYATLRAPGTPELLSARGGSFKVTEADEVSALIRTRFAAPLGESFALTLAGALRGRFRPLRRGVRQPRRLAAAPAPASARS